MQQECRLSRTCVSHQRKYMDCRNLLLDKAVCGTERLFFSTFAVSLARLSVHGGKLPVAVEQLYRHVGHHEDLVDEPPAQKSNRPPNRTLHKCQIGGVRSLHRRPPIPMTTLLDIKDMPGFNATVPNGTDSVSTGRVFFGRNPDQGGMDTVSCRNHGATNCVAVLENGGRLWRCLACNEGAYEPR